MDEYSHRKTELNKVEKTLSILDYGIFYDVFFCIKKELNYEYSI